MKRRTVPYDKIFIYAIQGAVSDPETHFGDILLAAWEDSGTTLLFFERQMNDEARAFAAAAPGAEFLSETIMDHCDWEAGSQISATRAGRFLVCPTWDDREPAPGELKILLDPGVAFGSGLHPTTRCALEMLEMVFETDRPEKFLDLGCGTGILSIAALLLGATGGAAVDYTPMATRAAAKCMELNDMEGRVEVVCGDAADNLWREADLVMSNIYFQVIRRLFENPEYFERKWLIISGIHGEEWRRETERLLELTGRKVIEVKKDENWYTYLSARRD